MKAFPELESPFALHVDGELGAAAWHLIQALARERAAASTDAPISYASALQEAIAALARAVMLATARHIIDHGKKRKR